jgi:DNA helicase-2/ATP-dependent DNA helicase PcrA
MLHYVAAEQEPSLMSIHALLDELNPEQFCAATTTAQNTLLLAGAGSGKTKTIVARAAYLISQGVPPEQIQILTFTRRAASEIVSRVQQYLGKQAQALKAATFHTFCLAILRRHAKSFALGAFSLIDRDDQLLMFRLLRAQQQQLELPKAQQLLELYSYVRNTQLPFAQALLQKMPELQDLKPEIMALMQNYEHQKRQRNYLDYDDILDYVATYLQRSDALFTKVLAGCQYLLVDEMQDTNPLQWQLIRPFIGKAALFCVGDDAQSIYAFRGADFKNIHEFATRVPHSQVLHLNQNYRSTQAILDLSNWLLNTSPVAYNKQLIAHRGDGLQPIMHTFYDFGALCVFWA